MKKTIVKQLTEEYVFTDEEMKALGLELMAKVFERETSVEEKKEANRQMNAKIKRIEYQMSVLAGKIEVGSELRSFECKLFVNHQNRTREWYDTTTNELIRVDPCEPEDLQLDAFPQNEIIQ